MKIKIEKFEVDVRAEVTCSCPAGTNYWLVSYCVDGLSVHSIQTKAIYGTPNPIELLESDYTWKEVHYTDKPNPAPFPKIGMGRELHCGTYGSRPAWWEICTITHREKLTQALNQLV